jgi:hypothetical protein
MGLISTGVKAVVAVKTADVIHQRIQHRQQEQWAAYGYPPPGSPPPPPGAAAPAPPDAPPPPPLGAPTTPTPTDDMETRIGLLAKLGELRDAGVLTGAEFEAQKTQLLAR